MFLQSRGLGTRGGEGREDEIIDEVVKEIENDEVDENEAADINRILDEGDDDDEGNEFGELDDENEDGDDGMDNGMEELDP